MDKHLICMAPFTEVEIDEEGNINCCCMQYTNSYFFGNIFEQSFDEVWNGEKAKAFRQDVTDGKYTFCKREICNFGRIKPSYEKPDINAPYPKYVTIAYDRTCNLKCITCRDHIIRNPKLSAEELNKNIEKYYLPICKNADELVLNSIGECLISRHSRTLIKKMAETYPNLKFNIMTNGVVCNELVLKNLGLTGKLSTVQVSIHAATKETYNKIARTGNFDCVMKNLIWLSNELRKGNIYCVIMNFVVHSENYKEMAQFVELAKELDILVSFWEFQKWSDTTEMFRNYEKYAVFDRKHPQFRDLLKVLTNPVFDYEKCLFNNLFKKLRQEALELSERGEL